MVRTWSGLVVTAFVAGVGDVGILVLVLSLQLLVVVCKGI